ncbi:hypothetical protein EBAPG3_010835 [Nitrosospira lacus]|uniref:Uncharacterized protein n=1 Tax=Nitrosospira lacus TaxID=1288494 RepID=A0A1W6SR02_9PROT|nr:hypothetical protein EBAPG3_010835 [Nitrosospira lacus]
MNLENFGLSPAIFKSENLYPKHGYRLFSLIFIYMRDQDGHVERVDYAFANYPDGPVQFLRV